MNNLIETRTFVEDQFKRFKYAAIGLGSFFIFVVILVSIYGKPMNNKYENWSAEGFLFMILCCILIVLLITFITMSFTHKRTVTCDLKECDIYATNFWNSYSQSDNFQWSEVSDTNPIEEYYGKGAYNIFIEVDANNKKYRLLTLNLTSKRDFDELLHLIDQSTPQLQYVITNNPDIGNRQIIVEVQKYKKVARI